MTIHSGRVYKIINVKSGTVLDLSGTDGTSVIGWQDHNGENQKWVLENDDNRWLIRNHRNGHYLGFLRGSYGLKDGLPLAGIEQPFHWDIYEEHGVYRIFVPGAPHPGLNVDLSDHGNPNNGTPVTLWGKWEGTNQTWRFEEV